MCHDGRINRAAAASRGCAGRKYLSSIGVDDQLQNTVWHNPALSVSVPVRPDGKITVPLIGDVVAGGKTPDEVSGEIKDKLQSYVRDPQVAVILIALRSNVNTCRAYGSPARCAARFPFLIARA